MKLLVLAYLGTALSAVGLTSQDAAQPRESLEMPSYQSPVQKWASIEDAPVMQSAQDDASYGDTWAEVDETNRHILIMSSIDGFAAAGNTGPCFKQSTNATIDESLMDAGFGSESPTGLPRKLGFLSEATDDCADRKRSYDTSLIQGMSDTHLSIYLTGAVAAYSDKAECPTNRHTAAAMTAAAAILSADPTEAPANVLRSAFQSGCSSNAS